MGEINITIKIEDLEMNTDDKIGHLKDIKEYEVVDFLSLAERSDILPEEQLKQWMGDPQKSPEERREERQKVIRHYEEHSSELYELFGENPEALKTEIFPDQVLYVVLTNTTSFSLETFGEKDIKRVIRGIIDKQLELNGKITKFGRGDSLFEGEEYYIELIVAEDKKEENRTICKGRSEILLLKEFWAQTEFGKVISFQIPHEVLDVFNKTSDFYVITSILGKASGYFYSADLGPDVEEHLLSEEYISLPQIDFSDYVNEVKDIVNSPLFLKICDYDRTDKIRKWLENIKESRYDVSMYGAVDHILRKISESLSLYEPGDTLSNHVEKIAGDNTNRRLLSETAGLIGALERNARAHWNEERPKWDDKYFTVLDIKAIRDVYYDWCLLEALNRYLRTVADKNENSFQNLWKEYLRAIKRSGTRTICKFISIDTGTVRLLTLDKRVLDVDLSEKSIKEVGA
jgi:hypothetical protein